MTVSQLIEELKWQDGNKTVLLHLSNADGSAVDGLLYSDAVGESRGKVVVVGIVRNERDDRVQGHVRARHRHLHRSAQRVRPEGQ
jgi:hypothetical protein